MREVVGAAVPLGTILVVNGLYFKTPALLLSVLATDKDVALYGVAYKAFEVLFALPSFVMVTLLPELARLDAGEPRFNAIVQKAFTAMTLLSLPIVGMALCGTEMMEVLGGSQYGEAGGLLAFILAAVTLACVQGVFGYTLVSQGRQGVLLKVSLTVLVVNLAANLILIPTLGLTGAGIALLASEVTSITLTMLVYRGVAPLPRRADAREGGARRRRDARRDLRPAAVRLGHHRPRRSRASPASRRTARRCSCSTPCPTTSAPRSAVSCASRGPRSTA